MLAGHIGVAAGAKAFDRRIPFWALLTASFLIDLLFGILLLFGVEDMSAMEGTDGGYGKFAFDVDYSHAFFTSIALSFVVLIFGARWFGGKGGFLLACVVFSHWFLDSIVHRPDMPIAPGNAGVLPRIGLGLWDAPAASMVLEALLVIGGAYVWYRSRPASVDDAATPPRDAVTRSALFAAVGGLVVLTLDVLT